MAYTINKTDGTVVTTITDGTVDNATSLSLFGKSYSGFGELLNENLVKLLENSASTSAPSTPLRGELWFDTSSNQIKVYDGTSFKPTGGSRPSASQPTSPSTGDLWHNTTDDQVYVYTGSAWLLVGPVYTSGQQLSGWKIESLASSGGTKVVSSMYAGNTRVAMLSKDTFAPSATQTGFATVKAGITLNSTLGAEFSGSTTIANFVNSAETTNDGVNIAGANIMRKDTDQTIDGALTVDDDGGVTIGESADLTINVASSDVSITNNQSDKDIIFKVNDSDGGGSGLEVMRMDGSARAVNITGNVTITGNLNVSGEYENTASEVNLLNDAFVKLNSGGGEADAGVIVETDDTDDARLFYDVSENHWTAGQGGTYSQVIRLSDAVEDGDANKAKVLKTTAAGNVKVTSATLGAVGTISEGDTTNTNVPTIGAVVTFGDLWGGSAKTVSTSAPTSGDGDDGDFWFVREA